MSLQKVVRMETVASDIDVEDIIKEAYQYAKDNNIIVKVNVNGVELKIYEFMKLQCLIDQYWDKMKGKKKSKKITKKVPECKTYNERLMSRKIQKLGTKGWINFTPDGLVYGWKEGICIIYRTGTPNSSKTEFYMIQHGRQYHYIYKINCTKSKAREIAQELLKEIENEI